jgi:hypothetical protein
MVIDEKTARDLMKSTMEHKQADEIIDKLLLDSEFRAVLERKLGELTKRENKTAVSC